MDASTGGALLSRTTLANVTVACPVQSVAADQGISFGAGYDVAAKTIEDALPAGTKIDEIRIWQGVRTQVEIANFAAQDAHLGGDDFFLTTTVPSAKILGAEVVDAFEAGRARLFTAQHQQHGHFHARNRAGEENIFPLTTLTAVVVTNEADDITHPGHIAAVLAELKTHAKTMDGSNFVCDRRSHHWTAQDGPDSSAIPEGKGFGDAGKK